MHYSTAFKVFFTNGSNTIYQSVCGEKAQSQLQRCLLTWQYHHFSEEVSSEFSIPKPISKKSTVINFHQSHRFQMLEMPKGGFGHDPLLLMIGLKDRMLAICSFLEVRCVVIALKTRHQNRIDWKNALRLSPMVICRYFSFLTRAKKGHSALCNKSFRSVVVILDLGQWALVEVLLPTRYSDCHKKLVCDNCSFATKG